MMTRSNAPKAAQEAIGSGRIAALPEGWIETTLGNVVDQPRAKASPAEHPELRFVGMDHIPPNSMSLVGSARFGDMKSNGGLFFKGDVLYGRMRPYLNKVHVAKVCGACSAEFIVFPKSRAVDSRFLGYLLHHRRFVNFASGFSSGDRPRVDFGDLSTYPVHLPPFGEQVRIASKIDELFSRIDEGERALQRVQKLVERYRQSVLKAAVAGELTREWREKHKGKLESGEALLARILEARREVWEKAERDKMRAKGHKPSDGRLKQKYREPSPPDTTELPELPKGWVWGSMDQVGIVSGGLTKNKKREDHELQRPYLRVANVYTNRLDLSEVHRIGISENELDRVLLSKGDILVVEGNGSIDQIGRVALWDGSIEGCVHQNHLIKVRCTEVLPSWYVLVWCMSSLGREQIRGVASSTAGLHTLSISKVQALPVPIPDAEELMSIQDRFEQMDSLVLNQQKVISVETRKSASLRQAVLRAAFSGALVPQDPADEPASVLLERIATERCTTSTATTKRTRKLKQPA